MALKIRPFESGDMLAMISIWNEVVREGRAFPQKNELNMEQGFEFFGSQSLTAVAEEDGVVVGLYILHPNNVGRCAHIANASYAVASYARGRGIGRALVAHCLENGAKYGFKVLQLNAVAASNKAAAALYESLGFTKLGTVPDGFLNIDNKYEDIHLFFHKL